MARSPEFGTALGWVAVLGAATVLMLAGWIVVQSTDSIDRLQRLTDASLPTALRFQRRVPMQTSPQRHFEIGSQPLAAAPLPWSVESSANLPAAGRSDGRVSPPEIELSEDEMPPLSPNAAQLASAAVNAVAEADYETAVGLLQEALSSDPHHPLLRRNLQMTLLNWGTAELNAERPAEALEALEQADELGNQPAVLRALGAALLRLDRAGEAVRALETALDLQPSDGQTLFFLSQALTEVDRRAEALDALMRAKEAGMRGAMVDRLTARLSREVDAEWDYVRSTTAHFDIDYHSESDSAVVADVAASLEDAFEFVGSRLDRYPTSRTRAVLYPQEDFHHFTQMPDWISGLFDGRIKIPLGGLHAGAAELDRVIRHEYAHRVILDIAGRNCPVWLNEGIAMWAEGNEEYRQTWALSELDGRRLLDLTSITGPLATLGEQQAKIAYAQSYLAVEHLAQRYGERRIAELLAELGRSGDLQEASRVVFRTDIQAVLATYFDSLTEG